MYHSNNQHLFCAHSVNHTIAVDKTLAKFRLANFGNNRTDVGEVTQALSNIQNLLHHSGCIKWRVLGDVSSDGVYILQRLRATNLLAYPFGQLFFRILL